MADEPPTLADDEIEAVFNLVRTGELLPCGGHRWAGGHNNRTPVFTLERDGRKKQLSARPLLWLIFEKSPAPGPLYSLHDPPCMEHLTLNRREANKVSVPVDPPENSPAGTIVHDLEVGEEEAPEEDQPGAHQGSVEAPPTDQPNEPLTRVDEAMSPDESQTPPYGGDSEHDPGSVGSHRPWQGTVHPRRKMSRRHAVLLAVVATVGLLHARACDVATRGGDPFVETPGPAPIEQTPPPASEPTQPTVVETTATSVEASTTSALGPAPMGVPDVPDWAPGSRP